MTTVRKMTKTTATLVILAVVLTLLMRWCGTLSGEFFYTLDALLNSRALIGGFHSILISFSFWLLLIVSGIKAVHYEESGVHALVLFALPFIFSVCVAVWGLVAMSTQVNLLWFWLFYSVGLIICVRISYGSLSYIAGPGPWKKKQQMKNSSYKNPKNYGDAGMVDQSVLYAAKTVMLVDWFALLISAVVYCIQYRQIFGL